MLRLPQCVAELQYCLHDHLSAVSLCLVNGDMKETGAGTVPREQGRSSVLTFLSYILSPRESQRRGKHKKHHVSVKDKSSPLDLSDP